MFVCRISGGTALKRNIHETVSKQIQANWAKGKWKVRTYKHVRREHGIIVYSIPAIERYKKERKGITTSTSETHKNNTKTHDTTQHNMGAGPWVPSLENWGGGLKSLLWLANSPHMQVRVATYLCRRKPLSTAVSIILFEKAFVIVCASPRQTCGKYCTY